MSVAFVSTGYPHLDDAGQGTLMNYSSPPCIDPIGLHHMSVRNRIHLHIGRKTNIGHLWIYRIVSIAVINSFPLQEVK